MSISRRKILLGLSVLLSASAYRNVSALIATPAQTSGPFYPSQLPLDDDNDLTRVVGQSGSAKGQITDLSGKIIDINGNPLPGLRIEIWQCDAHGRYRHSQENGTNPIDSNFQGHGFTKASKQGTYLFRTIRPVAYPGRTPHIHVAVFSGNSLPFVTQLYIAGEPRNTNDFIYRQTPADKRHLITSDFSPTHYSGAALQANFDIILDRTNGIPFQR